MSRTWDEIAAATAAAIAKAEAEFTEAKAKAFIAAMASAFADRSPAAQKVINDAVALGSHPDAETIFRFAVDAAEAVHNAETSAVAPVPAP